MIHSRYPLIGVNGKLNIAGIRISHSFIYSKFQQKKKRERKYKKFSDTYSEKVF